MSEVPQVLSALEHGDAFAAERLFPLVYDELRQMAQARLKMEQAVDSLQATALVHEAYIRLVDGQAGMSYKNRRYFFGAAGEAIAEMTGLTIHEVRLKWSYARALAASCDQPRIALTSMVSPAIFRGINVSPPRAVITVAKRPSDCGSR